jgi:hypothetical protein
MLFPCGFDGVSDSGGGLAAISTTSASSSKLTFGVFFFNPILNPSSDATEVTSDVSLGACVDLVKLLVT